jgi:outer membrane lipoprotein SlyB
LTLDSIQTADGKWVNLTTTSATFSAKSHKRRNLTLIGGGSGVGGLIGGIAGGGTGLAIGAASGAAAGLTGAYVTGNKDVTLPAESLLTLKTVREVALTR